MAATCVMSSAPTSDLNVGSSIEWNTHTTRRSHKRGRDDDFPATVSPGSCNTLCGLEANKRPQLTIDVAATHCRAFGRRQRTPSIARELTTPRESVRAIKRQRKRQRVRFHAFSKRHDGPCFANRIFDQLVWDYLTCSTMFSASSICEHVQAELAAENRQDSSNVESCGASTDSDDSEPAASTQTLFCAAMLQLSRQTMDLVTRLTHAKSVSPDTCVPVLPFGGGSHARLSGEHLDFVLELAQLVQAALELAPTWQAITPMPDHE